MISLKAHPHFHGGRDVVRISYLKICCSNSGGRRGRAVRKNYHERKPTDIDGSGTQSWRYGTGCGTGQ